jgi:hypothetical protein
VESNSIDNLFDDIIAQYTIQQEEEGGEGEEGNIEEEALVTRHEALVAINILHASNKCLISLNFEYNVTQ